MVNTCRPFARANNPKKPDEYQAGRDIHPVRIVSIGKRPANRFKLPDAGADSPPNRPSPAITAKSWPARKPLGTIHYRR